MNFFFRIFAAVFIFARCIFAVSKADHAKFIYNTQHKKSVNLGATTVEFQLVSIYWKFTVSYYFVTKKVSGQGHPTVGFGEYLFGEI